MNYVAFLRKYVVDQILKLGERNNTDFFAALWKSFPKYGPEIFPRENKICSVFWKKAAVL